MAGGAWKEDQNGVRSGKIAKFGRNIVNISAGNGGTNLKRYSGEARCRILSEYQVIILIVNGGGVKKAEKRQKSRDLGKISVICTVWTLQITDFEAMPENHQKSYGLENLTEGSLDQRKCSIKIWG